VTLPLLAACSDPACAQPRAAQPLASAGIEAGVSPAAELTVPRTLDVCAGDDVASAPKAWPPDTETPAPKRVSRFKDTRIREGDVRVTAGLQRDVVQRIVRQNFGSFRRCYENALWKEPIVPAEVTVRMVVDRSGAVRSTGVQSSSGPASVGVCVARAVGNLSFPARKSGEVIVTYPIAFDPPAGAPLPTPWLPRDGVRGATRWAQLFAGVRDAQLDDIAVDGRGQTVAAGILNASVSFGAIQLEPPSGHPTAFVLRLGELGKGEAATMLPEAPNVQARLLVAAAADGDVVVAGPTAPGKFVWPHPDRTAPGFLVRVRADGSVRWSRTLDVQTVSSLAMGPSGEVALTGAFLQGGVPTSRIVRWSADGEPSWAKVIGDAATSDYRYPAIANAVAIDRQGAVVVVGTVEPLQAGHLNLGLGVVNVHGESGFVARFAPDGRAEWTRGTAHASPQAVTVAGDRVILGGEAKCADGQQAPFVVGLDEGTGAERWSWRLPWDGWALTRLAGDLGGRIAFAVWNEEEEGWVGSIDPSGEAAWTRHLRLLVPSGVDVAPALAETAAGPLVAAAGAVPLDDLPEEQPPGVLTRSNNWVIGLAW
jgi:hypothetical protein